MAQLVPSDEQTNYEVFRDCLSEPIIRSLAAPVEKPRKKRRPGRRRSKDGILPDKSPQSGRDDEEAADDAEDLGDFIDYLSSLIFPSLPTALRCLSHSKFKDSASLQDLYSMPITANTTNSILSALPPTALDSLSSYALLPSDADANDLHNFFTPVLTSYINSTTAPPPVWSSTRTTECELCHRDWIPLTYHHLIPKSTHERVLKRGWHVEEKLNSVAWLCRACHSFVHKIATNEELAKEYWSVELLEERDEVKAWINWIGKVRWKKR